MDCAFVPAVGDQSPQRLTELLNQLPSAGVVFKLQPTALFDFLAFVHSFGLA